jgi:putative component of membrane protein insertase Oxa1/YidC/SpoIIIJ protein YidD
MRKIISTTRDIMKKTALHAISAYRRHLSPRKGYCCAYRVHAGGASCSAYGQRVIARYGVGLGLALLRRRLLACAWEQGRHAVAPASQPSAMRRQAGFCDAPGDCGTLFDTCDLLSKVADLWRSRRSCNFSSCNVGPCGGGASSGDMSEAQRRVARRRQAQMDANRPPGGDAAP